MLARGSDDALMACRSEPVSANAENVFNVASSRRGVRYPRKQVWTCGGGASGTSDLLARLPTRYPLGPFRVTPRHGPRTRARRRDAPVPLRRQARCPSEGPPEEGVLPQLRALGIHGESQRKSVEPIAALARGAPNRTKRMQDKLLQFLGVGEWSDAELRLAAAVAAATRRRTPSALARAP